MYKLKSNNITLLVKETEPEIYDAAFTLAKEHIGVVFEIWKGDKKYSSFACTDKPKPKIWSERAIQLLNGGPLQETLKRTLLDHLDTRSLHWSEIH